MSSTSFAVLASGSLGMSSDSVFSVVNASLAAVVSMFSVTAAASTEVVCVFNSISSLTSVCGVSPVSSGGGLLASVAEVRASSSSTPIVSASLAAARSLSGLASPLVGDGTGTSRADPGAAVSLTGATAESSAVSPESF